MSQINIGKHCSDTPIEDWCVLWSAYTPNQNLKGEKSMKKVTLLVGEDLAKNLLDHPEFGFKTTGADLENILAVCLFNYLSDIEVDPGFFHLTKGCGEITVQDNRIGTAEDSAEVYNQREEE